MNDADIVLILIGLITFAVWMLALVFIDGVGRDEEQDDENWWQ